MLNKKQREQQQHWTSNVKQGTLKASITSSKEHQTRNIKTTNKLINLSNK
jgi:hypothetical protein